MLYHTCRSSALTKVLFLELILLVALTFNTNGQSLTINEAIKRAKQNNLSLEASEKRILKNQQLISSAFNIEKTEVFYNYDENNLAPNNIPLKVWGVSQSFKFPTIYSSQKKVNQEKVHLAEDYYKINKRNVEKEVSKAYYDIVYKKTVYRHYSFLDSLYNEFSLSIKSQFKNGTTDYLDKLTAKSKRKEIALELAKSKDAIVKAYIIFNQWIQSDTLFKIADSAISKLKLEEPDLNEHPQVNYYSNAISLSQKHLSLEKQNLLPDLRVSVFQGYNNGPNAKNFTGFEAGIALPLWFSSNKSMIKAAQTEALILTAESKNHKIMLRSKLQSLYSDLALFEKEIDYYTETGKALSSELIAHATEAYKNGDITFLRFVDLLEDSKNIDLSYFNSLYNYNKTVLEINYISY